MESSFGTTIGRRTANLIFFSTDGSLHHRLLLTLIVSARRALAILFRAHQFSLARKPSRASKNLDCAVWKIEKIKADKTVNRRSQLIISKLSLFIDSQGFLKVSRSQGSSICVLFYDEKHPLIFTNFYQKICLTKFIIVSCHTGVLHNDIQDLEAP